MGCVPSAPQQQPPTQQRKGAPRPSTDKGSGATVVNVEPASVDVARAPEPSDPNAMQPDDRPEAAHAAPAQGSQTACTSDTSAPAVASAADPSQAMVDSAGDEASATQPVPEAPAGADSGAPEVRHRQDRIFDRICVGETAPDAPPGPAPGPAPAPAGFTLSYLDVLAALSLQATQGVGDDADAAPQPPEPAALLERMAEEWGGAEHLVHWQYATGAVPHDAADRTWDGCARDVGHEGMAIADFLQHPVARAAGLCAAEVVGLRLYTGPGYTAINRECRGFRRGFTTTVYVINTAIGRLAQARAREAGPVPPPPLVRGLGGHFQTQWRSWYTAWTGLRGMLTSDHLLLQPTEKTYRVISDAAFQSSSDQVTVLEDFDGPTVLRIRQGTDQTLDRWLRLCTRDMTQVLSGLWADRGRERGGEFTSSLLLWSIFWPWVLIMIKA